MDIEDGQMLAGEARIGGVLSDGGRAHGERWRELGNRFFHLLDRIVIARGHGIDEIARQSHAGRDGDALARRFAKPHSFRAVERRLARLGERNDPFHPSTVTSPASPSTRTSMPSVMRSVASRVSTTPGMPYSRA